MKKLSLLVGALGGTLAGYLFSNKPLRDQLAKTKDAEAAAKLLGKHLQQDGKQLAKEVQQFVQSEEVQENLGKAKIFAKEKLDSAKKELKGFVGSKKTKATMAAAGAAYVAGKAAKRAGKKVKKTAKKATKTMETKIRSLS